MKYCEYCEKFTFSFNEEGKEMCEVCGEILDTEEIDCVVCQCCGEYKPVSEIRDSDGLCLECIDEEYERKWR